LQVSGYFHAAQGVDPAMGNASLGNRFVALTDATITIMESDVPTRFEPVALLNTRHAQAYVWSDGATTDPAGTRKAEAVPAENLTERADSPLA
jgi:hypothetical protein